MVSRLIAPETSEISENSGKYRSSDSEIRMAHCKSALRVQLRSDGLPASVGITGIRRDEMKQSPLKSLSETIVRRTQCMHGLRWR